MKSNPPSAPWPPKHTLAAELEPLRFQACQQPPLNPELLPSPCTRAPSQHPNPLSPSLAVGRSASYIRRPLERRRLRSHLFSCPHTFFSCVVALLSSSIEAVEGRGVAAILHPYPDLQGGRVVASPGKGPRRERYSPYTRGSGSCSNSPTLVLQGGGVAANPLQKSRE